MTKKWFIGFSILLFAFVAAVPHEVLSQTNQQADVAAVREIVDHWQKAWDTFDASVLAGDYAEDADWMNSFGVKNRGSAKVVSFLAVALKSPEVASRHTVWDEPRIRFLRPDVAIVYRDYQTVGQKTPAGKHMPRRNSHSTWVLSKENGKWHIVSQVISDDKPTS